MIRWVHSHRSEIQFKVDETVIKFKKRDFSARWLSRESRANKVIFSKKLRFQERRLRASSARDTTEQEDERAGEGATAEASDAEVARGRTDAEDHGADTTDDELVMRTAAMQLESAPSPTLSSLGLRIQIPNPFDATEAVDEDVEMPTASPEREERFSSQRVAAAPALPQPPRFAAAS
ncbi:hypothetical protein PF001_g25828 [Phytophthora fragariae]|uniref:Uncharacterized protein n=1 Tax=Phytophthora fragariae TaxID=53985 RepID=A0A6A4BM24_9STRA|nr:hypothetical protein PF006_g26215 [Phytophthora fragariae]KAE9277086.1 hypothetical protein PF001_g25828 [Phytophthora fragariae]